eukprot:COSAG01_NODE_1399_length_10465_cov_3.558267_2_plen_114_part_00
MVAAAAAAAAAATAAAGTMTPAVRAVLFDIGGVIADSPVMAIRRHCRQVGAPDINPFLGASDAWNAYMRGDLSRGDFVHNLTRFAHRGSSLAETEHMVNVAKSVPYDSHDLHV